MSIETIVKAQKDILARISSFGLDSQKAQSLMGEWACYEKNRINQIVNLHNKREV